MTLTSDPLIMNSYEIGAKHPVIFYHEGSNRTKIVLVFWVFLFSADFAPNKCISDCYFV